VASTDLLAAEALVLIVRRFVIQDDIVRAAALIGKLGVDVGTDAVELQLATAAFVAASGADWAKVHVLKPIDHAVDDAGHKILVATKFVKDLLAEPPKIKKKYSDSEVVSQKVFTFEAEVVVGIGGREKIEVSREVLADGTVRVTVVGEAAVLAMLGIGGRVEGEDGAALTAQVGVGGVVTMVWDCPNGDEADKLLARLAASQALSPVGGDQGYLATHIAKWAGGTDLRVPPPTRTEIGGFVEGNRNLDVVAAGLGFGGGGDLRLGVSQRHDRTGGATTIVGFTGSAHRQLSVPGVASGGDVEISGSAEFGSGSVIPTTLEMRFSTLSTVAAGPGVAHATAQVRHDLVFTLNRAQLGSPAGRKLLDAVKNGNAKEVQRLIPKVVGGSAVYERWEGVGAAAGIDEQGGEVIGESAVVKGEYISWHRVAQHDTVFGYQG